MPKGKYLSTSISEFPDPQCPGLIVSLNQINYLPVDDKGTVVQKAAKVFTRSQFSGLVAGAVYDMIFLHNDKTDKDSLVGMFQS